MIIEDKLIKSCIRQDRKAQQELYKLCFAQLIIICYRFANNKDDASILLNDSFYKILNNLKNKKNDVPFKAWASRITINHCINEYKKDNTRKKLVANIEPEVLEQSADDSAVDFHKEIDTSTMKQIRTQILSLPPTTQEVFQLVVFQDCGHKEVAELLNMKEGTSKWHLNNARKILRSVLSETRKLLSSIVL